MKVLVVEDSLAMRRLSSAQLKEWDYEVLEAADGASAWEIFQREPAPLVLTDWMMPEMDGLQLIERIRGFKSPGYVYIILLTAKSEKEDLIAAMDAGADDFLVKPVDRDELRVRLREGERIIQLEHTLAEQNRALRETQAVLVQQEKLASLGQLAAGVAHEINNPIAFVSNNVTVLKREFGTLMAVLHMLQANKETLAGALPNLAKEFEQLEDESELVWIENNLPRLLDSCTEGLGRVRDIVQNLREFARLDEAQRDEINLNDALNSTAEILRHELNKKQIALKTEYNDLPPLLCNPGKINQVFLNLLLNAIQASKPEGAVTIRTHHTDNHLLVEFEDQGCGIDPENLPHIFEPFFTTKTVGQGKGLGLAISYGIVSEHGGTIVVDSEPERGSVFRVKFPLATESD